MGSQHQNDSRTPRVRGRPFVKGNGGRPPGSKNHNTLILAALMDGEKEELVRTGIELAKAGNVAILKYFYDRMLPRERVITIELPKIESADDAVSVADANKQRSTPGPQFMVRTRRESHHKSKGTYELTSSIVIHDHRLERTSMLWAAS